MHLSGATDKCPFELTLTSSGLDFCIRQMHFKLGLYEHQSASAIHAIVKLFHENPALFDSKIKAIHITTYEPAFSIIGDPAKKRPKDRQTADHSMYFIIAQLLENLNKNQLQCVYKNGRTLEQV